MQTPLVECIDLIQSTICNYFTAIIIVIINYAPKLCTAWPAAGLLRFHHCPSRCMSRANISSPTGWDMLAIGQPWPWLAPWASLLLFQHGLAHSWASPLPYRNGVVCRRESPLYRCCCWALYISKRYFWTKWMHWIDINKFNWNYSVLSFYCLVSWTQLRENDVFVCICQASHFWIIFLLFSPRIPDKHGYAKPLQDSEE